MTIAQFTLKHLISSFRSVDHADRLGRSHAVKKLLLIFALAASVVGLRAGNPEYAASASAANVQTAWNNLDEGGTLYVSGSATYNTSGTTPAVSFTGKGGTVIFSAGTITRGTGTAKLFLVQNDATHSVRVSGLVATESVAAAGALVEVDGSFSNQKVRIDHCTLTSTANGSVLLRVFKSWGVTDNCSFAAPQNSEMIHNEAWGPSDTSGWYDTVTPGGPDAWYVEDCTFTNNDPLLSTANPAYFWGCSAHQGYYGARTVFRYNHMVMAQFDAHGGALGQRWWEIYENTFENVLHGNQSQLMAIRSGSGVIYNNHIIGPANGGGGSIAFGPQFLDSATYKVGLGQSLAALPAHCWNNDAGIPRTFASPVVNGVDVIQSADTGFTPYTYPHPMRGGADTTAPTPNPATIASATATGTTTATVVASTASDETSLGSAPYAFSSDNGSSWTSYQSSATYNWTGLTPATLYHMKVRYQDAAGNVTTASAASDITTNANTSGTINNPQKARVAF